MMRRIVISLLAAFSLVLQAQAQDEQSATALRNTELRAKPYSDAAVVTTVKAKSRLTILKRQGGWYQARDSRNHTGWLRMSTIRLGDGKVAKSGDGGLAQTLRFLSTGRSGASGVTVATGIRGLDSADVANATPDHAAVKKLDRFKVSTANAKAFALNANLRSRSLGYIKEPK
jgi:uncharacterized protein YgiM (DUF1202 family)